MDLISCICELKTLWQKTLLSIATLCVIVFLFEQPCFDTVRGLLSYHECPPWAVTFSWWGIAYLNDPDSYAGWSFHTPVRATQAREVER